MNLERENLEILIRSIILQHQIKFLKDYCKKPFKDKNAVKEYEEKKATLDDLCNEILKHCGGK